MWMAARIQAFYTLCPCSLTLLTKSLCLPLGNPEYTPQIKLSVHIASTSRLKKISLKFTHRPNFVSNLADKIAVN